jgi:hypothetical protein
MSTSTETRSFTIGEMPTLIVRNTAGKIHVNAGPDGQVGLQITKKAHGGFLGIGGTERDLERVQVLTTQQGDTLRVDVEYEGSAINVGRGVTVDLELTIPAHTLLDLRLAAGDVRVTGVTGRIRVNTAAGNLETREVTFAQGSTLEVNAGKAEVYGVLDPGASLEVSVNTGKAHVTLPANTAATLDARVDVGAIQVTGFSGQLALSRELVQQRITGALGPEPNGSVRVRVNVGEITIRGE